ncbi:MAG: hypothetical protein IIA19_05485 [Thaumarchaeota archaeon]|nr:hypothetical protein [Nitrososphaerota archaeon]
MKIQKSLESKGVTSLSTVSKKAIPSVRVFSQELGNGVRYDLLEMV